MQGRFKTALKVALWSFIGLGAVGVGIATIVIYPGTPDKANSLRFDGFIKLPRGALLTVLDFMTVNDNALFVTDESAGNVYKIGLHDGALPSESDVSVFASEPAAHGVIVDPTSHLAYVTRSEANTVDVFEPKDMHLVKRISVADDPDAIFYDEFDKLVYVASADSKIATLIDPVSQAEVATIPLGGRPEYAVLDPQTKLLYQNLADVDTLVAVDLTKRLVVNRWALERCQGPSGMAIDEINRRLFIVCSRNDVLVIVDLNTNRTVTTLPIGGGPDSVAFDTTLHRIYTTGKSGVLVVIQQDTADTYHQLDSVRLHYGAHTLTFDPATRKVYVGYASLGVRARVAVFTPRS